ncbi:hypothetical protein ACFY7Z_12675 [Streptomyces sp. NPDC012623]|uniref:hypothetical protein n=1 Tax=unclassified Streptomyces TaxID=2593676 RepID=UPI0036C74539
MKGTVNGPPAGAVLDGDSSGENRTDDSGSGTEPPSSGVPADRNTRSTATRVLTEYSAGSRETSIVSRYGRSPAGTSYSAVPSIGA